LAAQRIAVEMKLDAQTTKQKAMDEKLNLILNQMEVETLGIFFTHFYFVRGFFFVTLIKNINLQ